MSNINTIDYWKKILSDNIDANEETIDKLADEFSEQLLLDDEENNILKISSCAVVCPRLKSFYDKKTNLTHKIAKKIFMEGKKIEDKTVAYIKFSQLISKLTKSYRQLQIKLKNEKQIGLWMQNDYKKARHNNQYELWLELKDRPLSDLIICPQAEPVQIAEYSDLEPFFKFLEANGKITDGQPLLEFNKGAFFSEGRIDLCKQVVGPTWIDKLMLALKQNTNVKHFLLGNNITNFTGGTKIANFISDPTKKCNIETWYLGGNDFDDKSIKLIAQSLYHDKHCTSLWLKRNPLGLDGAMEISQLLTHNKTIKIIDLQNTGLLDLGIRNLIAGLQYNDIVRHLYLDANGISELGIRYISAYIEHRNAINKIGITSWWLDINRLGDSGMKTLSDVLAKDKFIKRLSVGSNRFEHQGMKYLCESLANHPTLFMLHLGMYKATADVQELCNRIGNEGVKHLCKLLQSNNRIKLLNITHNSIEIEGIVLLAEAINSNDNLLHVEYEQYGLKIPDEIHSVIDNKLNENCMNNLGMNHETFVKTKLRTMKHTSKISNIDSIYRNV